MIKSLRAAALGALTLAAASPALAQDGAVLKSGPAEIPCLAFGLLIAAEAGEDAEAVQAGTIYTMFFHGRVRSAMSEIEVQQGLAAALNDFNADPDSVETHGNRCNAILDNSNGEMERLGKSLEAQE